MEHPIFNTPIKVNLTMEMIDNPGLKFVKNEPTKIPMWKVQNTKTGFNGYANGIVSRHEGFLDSPDTEYISGGISTKHPLSVAIGRHANFFMWGFSGAPDYMTEEAKQVFINTVIYMKQFNGKRIIVKKVPGIVIRDSYLDYKIENYTNEHFVKYKKDWLSYNREKLERKKKLEAKKEKGEKLNKIQESFLKDKNLIEPTFADYLKKNIGVVANQDFGDNHSDYIHFMNENREFFYPEFKGWRCNLILDNDVKEIGVSNRKIELLETCVKLLNKGNKEELAKRILYKYTNEKFETAREWEYWLKKNKNRLFFTEAGGYKWIVNTLKD